MLLKPSKNQEKPLENYQNDQNFNLKTIKTLSKDHQKAFEKPSKRSKNRQNVPKTIKKFQKTSIIPQTFKHTPKTIKKIIKNHQKIPKIISNTAKAARKALKTARKSLKTSRKQENITNYQNL
jgi:histone H1/5